MKMSLQKWIVKTGPKQVARLLNVEPSTVSAWKTFRACPRPHIMVRIKQLTKGQVTYDVMLENFVANSDLKN